MLGIVAKIHPSAGLCQQASTLQVFCLASHSPYVSLQPAYGAGLPALLNRYIPWRARKEVLRRFAGSSREQVRAGALLSALVQPTRTASFKTTQLLVRKDAFTNMMCLAPRRGSSPQVQQPVLYCRVANSYGGLRADCQDLMLASSLFRLCSSPERRCCIPSNLQHPDPHLDPSSDPVHGRAQPVALIPT